MPGPWITQASLIGQLANILKQSLSAVQSTSYWTAITTKRLQDGADYLTNVLLNKGFTIAQIDAWDYVVTYSTDHTLYLCLLDGAGLADYNTETIDKYNRSPELKSMTAISIGGIVTAPGASDGAGIESGSMDAGSIRDFDRELRRRVCRNAYRPPI